MTDGLIDAGRRSALTTPVRTASLVLAMCIGFGAGACSLAADPVIDTWPIGAALDCPDAASCAELVRVGVQGLDQRDPGHAQVVATYLHQEGAFVDPTTGDRIFMQRSGGCCHVLVVELADGSTHAIGVGFPGVSDQAVAIPWEEMSPSAPDP
jgi:hypothetical protein